MGRFYRLSTKSILRKSGDIVYASLTTIGAFLILSGVKQDFALIVYVLLRKTPTFKVLNCFVAQIKRVLLNEVEVDLKKLTISMFLFITAEGLVVNTIALAINQKKFFI